jgi:poly(U)-binding-splicing factor PUF60
LPIIPNNPAGAAAAAAMALQAGQEQRNILVISRIYVGSINFDLNEEHMKAVFSQFGWVKNVGMTMDPATGKHKGFCFVEYDIPEAAELALAVMNGADLGGRWGLAPWTAHLLYLSPFSFLSRALKVGRPNNYNPAIASMFPPPPAERIYVANVNELLSESDLSEVFGAFGAIKSIALMPDPVTRKHKTCG